MNSMCMLFIIANCDDESRFTSVIEKYKVGFKIVMYGIGSASDSLLEYFELVEDEKIIMIAILPFGLCRYILRDIDDKGLINKPGNGIAFSIPLSSSIQYILDFYKDYEMEDVVMSKADCHLIVTIVNEGYAEKVMTDAKRVGATGGTTLCGRGLGDERVKFLNIAIEPEKDVVLILTSDEKKNDIMNVIIENCGLKTPGAGICFSLPVDCVVGLHKDFES